MEGLTQTLFWGAMAMTLSLGNGLQCYQCAYKESDPIISPEENLACKNANFKFATNCGPDQPYCLEISGLTDGKPVGLLTCAAPGWKQTLGDQRCVPSHTLTDFKFKIRDTIVPLQDGFVCICDSDLCNGPRTPPGPHDGSSGSHGGEGGEGQHGGSNSAQGIFFKGCSSFIMCLMAMVMFRW